MATNKRAKEFLSLVLAFACLVCFISFALLAVYFAGLAERGLLEGSQKLLAFFSYLPLGGVHLLARLGRRWGLEGY